MSLSKNILMYAFLPLHLFGGEEAAFQTLEEEYTPKYCTQLEAAYGEGLMSEGGQDGIELMFKNIPLENRTALDIGSGLGGVTFYLSDKYNMNITGLDVNKWMIEESIKRIPEHLTGKVNFYLSTGNSHWPFLDESYDIIYSKGVLTHLESKDELFNECHRILKGDGLFIITDWLSSDEKRWGKNVGKLVALEKLVLYPESEQGYIDVLKKNGFAVLNVRDDSSSYYVYNLAILDKLKNIKENDIFNQSELDASIVAYEAIAKAMDEKELRVIRFVVKKDN